ncbi:MAG: hypothetical protein IKP35_01465 [Alphaproteobacteria bacterium]|nr:hypothetical protein [Alphaproteobacteria bacterium]
MFNDVSIVSTAVSSFNNAALYSPYFFVVGLFSIPLFFMVYLYGRDFITRIGWANQDIEAKVGFWSVLFLVLWLMIFGGNYAVIRDGISLLPVSVATVLFASMVFVVNQAKKMNYLSKIATKKSKWFVLLSLVVLAVFSAKPTLWGILLQLSAVFCGMVVGSRLNTKLSNIFWGSMIFVVMSILILMQPEFFRFGQLGNLTLIHVGAVLLCGFFGITALVAKYTNARGKIYQSAYIKLKWLFRILSIFAFVLLVSTESVPVFAGLLASLAINEMLSIYHGKTSYEKVFKQSWALMLISFGIIIICPVISLLGTAYLFSVSEKLHYKDFTKLL